MIRILVFIAALAFSTACHAQKPYEVDEFRPDEPGKAQALNLAPSAGATPYGFYGYAWIHILDADNRVDPDFAAAQLGINATDVVLGSVGFGNAPPKPVAIMLDNFVAVRVTATEVQIPAGRIVITRSSTGAVLEFKRSGVTKGRIIVDVSGARFEGFPQITDMENRIKALEAKIK